MAERSRIILAACVSVALVAPLSAGSTAQPAGRHPIRHSAVGVTSGVPPERVRVAEPLRVRSAMPKPGAVRATAAPAVRPVHVRHMNGPRMLQPAEAARVAESALLRDRRLRVSPMRAVPPASGSRAPAQQQPARIAAPPRRARGGLPPGTGPGTGPVTPPPGGGGVGVVTGGSTPTPTPAPTPTPPPPLGGASGTGIKPWWGYQEQSVPGGGQLMVNVGSGNMLVQNDDMAVPHKGVALAFRRTYNSQSRHDVAGSDGAQPGMFGNGWTNTFDAHLSGNVNDGTLTVWDIDGGRFDYTGSNATGWRAPPGQHATLAFDGGCGYLWTKKSGTTYYFYSTTENMTVCGYPWAQYGGFGGRLYQIIGRNRNVTLTFGYGWDAGNMSLSGKLGSITVQTESGLVATMNFADVNGYRLLQQLVFPDGATSVSYGYDGNGNLVTVSRPPNNAAGTRPQQTFGYANLGSGSTMASITSPRWNNACGWTGCPDGGAMNFAYTGTGPQNATLSLILHFTQVNPSVPDGTGSNGIQSGYPTTTFNDRSEYYGTGVATPTYRDTAGHMANWVADAAGRVTQAQRCTESTNQAQQCTGVWLVSNETWNADNQLAAEVDPRGNESDQAFDADGNTVATAEPPLTPGGFRPTRLYSYDAHDNLIAYCDPNATHALGLDWTGSPAAPLPGQGGLCPTQSTAASRFQYTVTGGEPFGELTGSTTPATASAPGGYQRTYGYDPSPQGGVDYGLPTSVTGTAIAQNDATTPSRQPQQTLWYDVHGRLTCYGTGNGQWLLTYDALGRMTHTADPDDSSLGAGACAKTGAQPSWNTTSTINYFPDGSVSSRQSASQVANGVSTSFTYDPDGNATTETHHFGCLTVASCAAGVTQRFYDGADRLIEVLQPFDAWDVQQYPWATRYVYDIGTGNATAYRGMALGGHGNLVATQEFMSGTVWKPLNQAYPQSSGSWVDVRATSYDALDRTIAQYEASTGDTPKVANTYDGANAVGLLSSARRATGESVFNTYDALGRVTDVSYAGDGGITAPTHARYDAAGHVTSRWTDALGAETMQYDAVGELTSLTEPPSLGGGTMTVHYYPDGSRRDVGYTDGAYQISPVAQYTYRNDARRQSLQLSNGTSFRWTYTAAGRELTEADPLTGTTISPSATYMSGRVARPVYPAHMTYAARTVAYDTFGRIAQVTLPETPFTTGYSYDLEDGVAQNSNARYVGTAASPSPPAVPTCVVTNVRNELMPNLGNSDCAYFTNPNTIPHSAIAGLVFDGGAGQWTIDERSSIKLNNQSQTTFGVTVGSAYTYDASGRLTQDSEARAPACPPGDMYVDPRVSNPHCYAYGTRTKTYDAENRLRSDIYPYADPNRPVQTSYGLSYADYWMELDTFYQPANIAAVDYNAASHPARITLQYPQWGTSQTSTWLWDGADRFLACQLANGACSALTFSLEGLGDYDPRANAITVYDRNRWGLVSSWHTATAFGQWSESYAGPRIYRATIGTCSDGDASDPAACGRLRAGKLTSDGWTIDNDTWQGVRTSDLTIGQWNTPDAFAGNVNDPMSQKPYMWNRNNPFEYRDPSGYDWASLYECRDLVHGAFALGGPVGGFLVADMLLLSNSPNGDRRQMLGDAIAGSNAVIGHYPIYKTTAEQFHKPYFEIPQSTFNNPIMRNWTDLQKADYIQHENDKWIDKGIANSWSFVVVTEDGKIRPGSGLEKEIERLKAAGYDWDPSDPTHTRLIKKKK